MLSLDIMHTIELGVCGHAVANLFHEIVCEQEHGTISSIISRLWQRIREIYAEEGVDHCLSNFKFSLFVKDKDSPHSKFPELSSAVKAAS